MSFASTLRKARKIVDEIKQFEEELIELEKQDADLNMSYEKLGQKLRVADKKIKLLREELQKNEGQR